MQSPAVGPRPDDAVRVFSQAIDLCRLISDRWLGDADGMKAPLVVIPADDAIETARPQPALTIHQERRHFMSAQTIHAVSVRLEQTPVTPPRFQRRQTAPCRHPQSSLAVPADGLDSDGPQFAWLAGRRSESPNLKGFRIEPVESAGCPHPEAAVRIFEDGGDGIVAQAVHVTRVLRDVQELVPVKPVQAVLGAEPHETPTVLDDAEHVALRQPLIDGQVGEHETVGVEQRQRSAPRSDCQAGKPQQPKDQPAPISRQS